MAGIFVSASSQRLVNTASSITDYPCTVGAWVNFTNTIGTKTIWSIADSGTTNNYLTLHGTTAISVFAAAGGTANGASTANFTSGGWIFVIGRFVSSTNRHVAAILTTGATSHGATSTARAPTGIDTMAIGALEASTPTNFANQRIGEIWWTNTDIQADGAQLQDSLLSQLAYGGPFSVPNIAKDILEYRSLRSALTSDADAIGDVFSGALGAQTWTNTNGVTIGAHPPLPYRYVKPDQYVRNLTV